MAQTAFGRTLATARVLGGMSERELGVKLLMSHTDVQDHEAYGRYLSNDGIRSWMSVCGQPNMADEAIRLRDTEAQAPEELDDGKRPVDLPDTWDFR